ncbi:hypothetical protein BJ944DRAFT_262772 [Cunninghamella echinulata]|nr:hypothetical protein BJ944DRAFT_262772 [Cunninghamella echinulata]
MLSLTKASKTIDIQLLEEKYYFPGQTIKGFVTIQPKTPTKTNRILLKFTGEVAFSLKDKDNITLFQKTIILNVKNNNTEEHSKGYVMEPKLHTLPFELIVPEDIQLPSTMDFNKKVRVKYTLVAIHDKSMVPESLCPKIEYPVHILEFIDTEDPKLKIPKEKLQHAILSTKTPDKICSVQASIPRHGFTRGDIIPVTVVVNHCELFALPKAIEISLIRIIEVRHNKTSFIKEHCLATVDSDLYIKSTSVLTQTIKRQLLIPSSTPPTIQFREELLRIDYKVRVLTHLVLPGTQNKSKEEGICTVDLPVIVGTWPRASIPIDDDDDDINNNNEKEISYSQDIDFLDIESPYIGSDILDTHSINSGKDQQQQDIYLLKNDDNNNNHQQLTLNMSTDTHSTNSSTSTIKLKTKSPTTSNFNTIGRSDSITSKSSNKSFTSYSSWKSNQSWDNSSMSLSRNTSLSTNVSKIVDGATTPTIPPTTQHQNRIETIIMQPSSSPSVNNSSNISAGSLTHRSSDPVGLVHPLSIHRHSYSEHNTNNNNIAPINSSSPTLSQRQNSIAISLKSNDSNNLSVYSPTRSIHQSFSNSDLTSLNNESVTSNAILLQPVETPSSPTTSTYSSHSSHSNINSTKVSPQPSTIKKTIHFDMDQQQNKKINSREIGDKEEEGDVSDSDDSDDDDDDMGFLTTLKKKEKQDRLNEQNRLYMTEMTA